MYMLANIFLPSTHIRNSCVQNVIITYNNLSSRFKTYRNCRQYNDLRATILGGNTDSNTVCIHS